MRDPRHRYVKREMKNFAQKAPLYIFQNFRVARDPQYCIGKR